jgi:hypothetical protein
MICDITSSNRLFCLYMFKYVKSSSSAYLRPYCWSTGLPYGLLTRRRGHNLPRRLSEALWVLTTANTAGANGLTCLPKHGGARDITFFGHPSDDRPILLSFHNPTPSALTAEPSSSSFILSMWKSEYNINCTQMTTG